MNKNLKVAMFAFVAIAALSIGFSPIMAHAAPIVMSNILPVPAGFAVGPYNGAACGTGGCVAAVSTDTVWQNIAVTYGTTGNNCQVQSMLTVNGAPVWAFGANVMGTFTVNVPFPVVAGDNVMIVNNYNGCT